MDYVIRGLNGNGNCSQISDGRRNNPMLVLPQVYIYMYNTCTMYIQCALHIQGGVHVHQ